VFRYSALELCFEDDILATEESTQAQKSKCNTNVNGIASLLGYVSDGAKSTRRKHDLVVIHE